MCRGEAELKTMVAWVRLTYTNDSGGNGATTGARYRQLAAPAPPPPRRRRPLDAHVALRSVPLMLPRLVVHVQLRGRRPGAPPAGLAAPAASAGRRAAEPRTQVVPDRGPLALGDQHQIEQVVAAVGPGSKRQVGTQQRMFIASTMRYSPVRSAPSSVTRRRIGGRCSVIRRSNRSARSIACPVRPVALSSTSTSRATPARRRGRPRPTPTNGIVDPSGRHHAVEGSGARRPASRRSARPRSPDPPRDLAMLLAVPIGRMAIGTPRPASATATAFTLPSPPATATSSPGSSNARASFFRRETRRAS